MFTQILTSTTFAALSLFAPVDTVENTMPSSGASVFVLVEEEELASCTYNEIGTPVLQNEFDNSLLGCTTPSLIISSIDAFDGDCKQKTECGVTVKATLQFPASNSCRGYETIYLTAPNTLYNDQRVVNTIDFEATEWAPCTGKAAALLITADCKLPNKTTTISYTINFKCSACAASNKK